MSTAPIHGPIQIANKTAAAWSEQNPVLLAGQLGLETDTSKLKAGDGVSTWSTLGYVTGTGGGGGGASKYTDLTDATTAPLPTTNQPLLSSLSQKAPLANPTFTGTVGGLTKAMVALGSVDNTSDASKPVSTAQAAAIALKANLASPAFTGTPTGITKTHVGLGSVDNTADLAKPVSTATATALAAKQASLTAGTGISIDGTNTINVTAVITPVSIPYDTAIPLDTTGAGKFMTAHKLTASQTFTVGPSPTEQGNCNFCIIGDGTHTIDVTAFSPGNAYTFDTGNDVSNIYTAIYTYGTAALFGFGGNAVATPPGQVLALLRGTATATTQPLSWTAPASGGTPTDYFVEYKASSSGTWLTFSDGVSTGLSTTVFGLVNSTSYDYRVSAVNAAGQGTPSATSTGSTLSPPGQVTGLTAGSATTTTQPLTWTAPSTGGATSDYVVSYKTSAGSTWIIFPDGASTTPSVTITGLTSGVSYDYRVFATNGAGDGTVSATVTASTSSGGGKITFTDDFAGTDGAAPNARWTGTGWTIRSNSLHYSGASYGVITADCTAGDNTVSVDFDTTHAGVAYAGIFIRYVDSNNYTAVQFRYENGDKLRIYETVAGVSTTIADDTVARNFNAANLTVATVGTAITVTVSGGAAPGSFGGTLTTANNAATKIALGMNTDSGNVAMADNFYDNCVLS